MSERCRTCSAPLERAVLTLAGPQWSCTQCYDRRDLACAECGGRMHRLGDEDIAACEACGVAAWIVDGKAQWGESADELRERALAIAEEKRRAADAWATTQDERVRRAPRVEKKPEPPAEPEPEPNPRARRFELARGYRDAPQAAVERVSTVAWDAPSEIEARMKSVFVFACFAIGLLAYFDLAAAFVVGAFSFAIAMFVASRADAEKAARQQEGTAPRQRTLDVTDEVVRIPHAGKEVPRARVARVRVRLRAGRFAVMLEGAEVVVDELESLHDAKKLKAAIERELER